MLSDELAARKNRNSSYGLRRFASDLSISPARLSEVLSGKGNLSPKSAHKIAPFLNFAPRETEIFIRLVEVNDNRNVIAQRKAKERLEQIQTENTRFVDRNYSSLIGQWYSFAILSVMDLDCYDGTPEWISARLGLEFDTTMKTIALMEKSSLVIYRNGKYLPTGQKILSTEGASSSSLRQGHQQYMQMAMESMIKDAPFERDVTSATMSVDIEKIQLAKERIKKFKEEMSDLLESGNKNSVYALNIQFFPVVKGVIQ